MEQVLQDLISLTGYTPDDAALLNKTSAKTAPWMEEVTQVFYNTLYGYSSTSAVFRDGERPAREDTLRGWYQRVTQGQIDDAFWRWQWFVGLVHIPRNITNPYMLGMMSRVQLMFLAKCTEAFEPAEAQAVFSAFKRVTDVIAGLIADGYFQSYVNAMERMSGQSRALIDRMVQMEVTDMVTEFRAAAK